MSSQIHYFGAKNRYTVVFYKLEVAFFVIMWLLFWKQDEWMWGVISVCNAYNMTEVTQIEL